MAGRPTKYDPAFVDAVVEDARLGYSLGAFAGGIEVDRDTITEWRKVHSDFDQACRTAKLVRARRLETEAMDLGIAAPAAGVRKLALANCNEDDWRDQTTLKHVGGDKDDAPIRTETKLDVTGLTDEQLRALSSIRV